VHTLKCPIRRQRMMPSRWIGGTSRGDGLMKMKCK
jgi:hypothetical protein